MANPQAEEGHIDMANEIGEALAKTNLSAYESRILWALWRKTYGWHKREDRISISQFQKLTELPRRHVSRTLSELVRRKIVTKRGDTFVKNYSFQKDYSQWKTVTKRGDRNNSGDFGDNNHETITRIGDTLSPKGVTISSPKGVHTKEKKENIQKKEEERPLFASKEENQEKAELMVVSIENGMSPPEPKRNDPKKMLEEFNEFRRRENF